MSKHHATVFHHRHYRYVRMMLRRYPKMRNEIFGLSSEAGCIAICGGRQAYLDRWARISRNMAVRVGERILALNPAAKSS